MSIFGGVCLDNWNVSSNVKSLHKIQMCSQCSYKMLIFYQRKCNTPARNVRVCSAVGMSCLVCFYVEIHSAKYMHTCKYTLNTYIPYTQTRRLLVVHLPQFLIAFNGDFQFDNSVFASLFEMYWNSHIIWKAAYT